MRSGRRRKQAACSLLSSGFYLLTGARRGEAAGLQWDEIDNNGVWTLPAVRNKNKTDLSRPLSKAALAIVQAQPRIDDSQFVFTLDGKQPVSFGRTKINFIDRSGVKDWRMHDLRRTARTLLSRAGVDVDTAERCLGQRLPGSEQPMTATALSAKCEGI